MAPYHILIVIISSVIPENLVLLTKSEQSGPKSAHIRPTIPCLPQEAACTRCQEKCKSQSKTVSLRSLGLGLKKKEV